MVGTGRSEAKPPISPPSELGCFLWVRRRNWRGGKLSEDEAHTECLY